MSRPSPKIPHLVTIGLIVVGLLIAALGGITGGSIVGGIIAAAGVIPALWGAWVGMQQETQGSLAVSLLLGFGAAGIGGVLILLAVVDWLR